MIQLILVLAYTALFIQVIRKGALFRDSNVPTAWLQLAFTAKVIAGSALGWLYFNYYRDERTADTIKFFRDSEILFNTLYTHPKHFLMMLTGLGGTSPELRHYYESMSAWLNNDVLFNDNKTIIRMNAFFRFFSCGNYYVHVVFINFISFTGLYCLYRLFSPSLGARSRWYFIALFSYPSLLFWGSGLLKDGILLFALGVVLITFHSFIHGERRLSYLIYLILSLVLLVFTKFYVICAVLPGLIAWYWARNSSGMKTAGIFLLVYTLFIVSGFNVYHVLPRFDLADVIYWKQHNFMMLARITNAKSAVPINELSHGAWSILYNAPEACLRTLLRPGLTDNLHHPLILISAAENTILLGLLLAGAFVFRLRPLPQFTPLTAFCICFTVIIFTLTGLITPILGALVRYKVVAFPFLAYAVLVHCGSRKALR